MSNSSGLRNKLPWIAAIVLGVLSILAVNKFLRLQSQSVEQNLVYMLTAAKDLSLGDELSREDIQLKLFPAEAMSQLSITVPGRATDAAGEETERKILMLIGRKTARAINKDEQIFWSDLAEQQKTRFPDRIPENMRAVSIPVSGVSAVSNLVEVGDKVDVVFSGESDSSSAEMELIRAIYMPTKTAPRQEEIDNVEVSESDKKKQGSTILLSNVTVLAIGSSYLPGQGEEANSYSSVTLLVTPEEGVLLIQAQGAGQLSLMLRTPVDMSVGQNLVVSPDSMFEISRKLDRKRQTEVKK